MGWNKFDLIKRMIIDVITNNNNNNKYAERMITWETSIYLKYVQKMVSRECLFYCFTRFGNLAYPVPVLVSVLASAVFPVSVSMFYSRKCMP